MPSELIQVGEDSCLKFQYSAGIYGSRFLEGLREGRILASRCARCRFVLVPPRIVCANCYAKMEEFVSVGPEGTLETFTQVCFPFIDPETGRRRPVPYVYGLIRLDGANNTLQHFLEETDVSRLRIGQRVAAVFRETRAGTLLDIQYFRTVKEL